MTANDGPVLHLRPTAPCHRCHADLSALDLHDGLRCGDCTDLAYRRLISWTQPQLRTPSSSAHSWATPSRDVPTPVLVVALAAVLALFLGLILVGQQAMCTAHDDALRYCQGYEAQQ